MDKIYVITNPELGWDCVVAVRHTLKEAVELCGGEYNNKITLSGYDFDNGNIIHEVDYPYLIT